MVSIGVFISSLTISQIIAAIGTFVVSVFLMLHRHPGGGAVSSDAVATVVDLDLL